MITAQVSAEAGAAGSFVVSLTDVPDGAFLAWGLRSPDNETFTVTGVSDNINGAWSLSGTLSGPVDDAGGTSRFYAGCFQDSAPSASLTITIAFDATPASGHIIAAWFSSDVGDLTLQETTTPLYDGGSDATPPSPTSTPSGSNGVYVGIVIGGGTRTVTAVGTDEVCPSSASSQRCHVIYEPFTSGGSKSLEPTLSSASSRTSFHAFMVLEASAGTTMAPDRGALTLTGTALRLGLTINMPDEL